MPAEFKQLTDFLVRLGIDQVAHTQKDYLAHLISVYKLMQRHGQEETLCRAGLFHSIYGTEKFQGFKLTLDQRPELTELIGERAEKLAFWNCLMDRASFDSSLSRDDGPFVVLNRETGEAMHLSLCEYNDLCCVHLFDWLEQVPRSRYGWDYRRQAYEQMAARLDEQARLAYEQAFAKEPVG